MAKNGPATLDAPPGPADDVTALRAEIADLRARLDGGLGFGSPSAAEVAELRQLLGILGKREARLVEEEEKARARYEELKAVCERTTAQRTQDEADRRFQGPRRFKVGIPGDKAQPVVEINAHSEDEARGSYTSLCGIRACDWEISVGSAGQPLPTASESEGVTSLAQLHGGDG